jgi:hypothetical protein
MLLKYGIIGMQARGARPVSGVNDSMDMEGGEIFPHASCDGGSGSLVVAAGCGHVSTSSAELGGAAAQAGGSCVMSADGCLVAAATSLPESGSAAASSDQSFFALPSGLAAKLAGPALSAESLQIARDMAERRLRYVRRLVEESLREDLELQAR